MFIGGLAGLEKLREEKSEAVDRASVMAGLSLGAELRFTAFFMIFIIFQ